jgi:Asp-tRNA(Asn)/Glu-tRNA(Gln) amidotransferase A subunit family amidase
MKKWYGISVLLVLTALVFFLLGVLYVHQFQLKAVNTQTLASAAKVLGLEFTVAERDSMIEDVREYLNQFSRIRSAQIDNAIPPALQFNPIPLGMNLQELKPGFRMDDYSATMLPEHMDDLAFYSIGQLAHLLKTRQITSLQLTEFFLQRLKSYGPTLECVITLTEDLALREARRADAEIAAGKYRGPLHGIPYGVKDLLAVRGYKTTWGAMPYKDQVINEDATVVVKLREAGAVLAAKLTMGALAWGDVWYDGKTRNPWNPEQGSSGSSAGSASAVAAGLLPFAIGTETWGSIVSPSTVCGTTGLRPTYGRVSRHGAMALSWSMDKIGPITRYAEDCALVFEAIHGPDGLDQTLYDIPFSYSQQLNLKSLRVGYLVDDFNSDYAFKTNDSLALHVFRDMGIDLIPIQLPFPNVGDLSFILSAEAAAAFDALTLSNRDDLMVRQIRNAWPNVFRHSRFIPAVEYINANRLRYQLIQEMQELMKKVDLYLAPSWQGNNLLLTNLTGHPCVVFPNGFTSSGTPTSMTINGRLFDEGRILALAKMFQDRTNHHKKHPQLDSFKGERKGD